MKYAVIVHGSRWVEGDLRSQQSPGHGYPAHHEPTTEFLTFESEEDLIGWMHLNRTARITAIRYEELEIETKLTVKVVK